MSDRRVAGRDDLRIDEEVFYKLDGDIFLPARVYTEPGSLKIQFALDNAFGGRFPGDYRLYVGLELKQGYESGIVKHTLGERIVVENSRVFV